MTNLVFCLDAFADAADAAAGGSLQPIHIRIQQRNGRKTLTTVQGIPSDYDQKKIVRAFKKVWPIIDSLCFIAYSSVNFGALTWDTSNEMIHEIAFFDLDVA